MDNAHYIKTGRSQLTGGKGSSEGRKKRRLDTLDKLEEEIDRVIREMDREKSQ